MNIEDLLADLTPLVEGVATDMGGRYGRYGMDRQDAAQTAYLWLFEHPRKVEEYLADGPHGIRKLARALRNECQDAGEEAKAARLGYSRDDLFYFSKGMIRELLPKMFDEEAWLHPETPDLDSERRAPSAPAEGGNWIATLVDVSRAYSGLDSEDRDLLAAFHRDQWSNKLLAESYGVSEQTMSYRHDQAVKRLLDRLGGPKPRPQHDGDCEHAWGYGRRAMSNATARWVQQTYYEED